MPAPPPVLSPSADRRPFMQDNLWSLTGHVCLGCLGRVLECDGVFMCADCEAEAKDKPDAICGCGLRIEGITRVSGFRCGPNPSRSAETPGAIAILFAGSPAPETGSPPA